MPRLTEQEQQEIIRFIEADKPLPDKYRFLLFEDKRRGGTRLEWQDQRGPATSSSPSRRLNR